jgi:hypothetical protein
MIDSKAAAAELGVSWVWIRTLLAKGRVRGAVKAGRSWRIPTPVIILRVPQGRPRRGVEL